MNRSIKDFFTASLFFALCSTAYFTQAQTASNVAQSAIMKPTDLLVKEIAGQSQMMQNLEEMCDGIGPRLTGSEQLRKAQAWAIEKLKSYGAVNVHEEAYAFGRPWSRGTTSARLLNANGQRLNIEQKAWTSGTAGKITAEVALLDVKTLAEFKLSGRYRGHCFRRGSVDAQYRHLDACRREARQLHRILR